MARCIGTRFTQENSPVKQRDNINNRLRQDGFSEGFLPKPLGIQRRCILLIFFICVVSTHGLVLKGFYPIQGVHANISI